MDVSKYVDAVQEFLDTHKKFLASLVAAVTVAVAVITDDKHVDLADIVAIVGAFTGAGAVQAVPNRTKRSAQARTAKRKAKRAARD